MYRPEKRLGYFKTASFAALSAGALLFAGAAMAQTADTSAPIRIAHNDAAPPTTGGSSAPTQTAQDTVAPQAAVAEEVVVTGSRIPRAGFDTLQPAETLSAQTLRDRGFNNISDALNELPAFGDNQNIGQQSGSQVGEQFVNLYNLGSQRTLVLVDGRRFVSGYAPIPVGTFGGAPAGQEVDLNDIPVGLIDHVEVVSVGGAPVYGADAIAGTVNIILKKNYEGATIDANYGESARGDGKSYVARTLIGTNFADDRGNVTVSLEYTQQDGITQAQRRNWDPYDTQQPSAACTALGYGACLVPNATVASLSASGVPTTAPTLGNLGSPTYPYAIHNAAGQPVAFNSVGQLEPFNFGTQNSGSVFAAGGDGLDLANENQLVPASTRINFATISHYDFAPHITGYLETEYSHVDADQYAAQSFYNSALFASDPGEAPLEFNVNNPFLTAQAKSVLQAAGVTNFYLSRSNLDLGNQGVNNTIDTFRIVPGFKGDFSLWGRKVNWDASFNYGRSEADETTQNINLQNFENAINVVTGPNGQPECAVTANPPALPTGYSSQPPTVTGCQPLNLFGSSSPSAAAKKYVEATDHAIAVNTERDVQLNANTAPFDVWAGPVQVAVGFEYRQETGSYSPDAFEQAGLGFGGSPVSPVSGSYDSTEFYAETTIPVLSPKFNFPFAYSAELDGSIREIDNSYAGTNDVYSIGAKFAPVKDIQFRGNITHSVRAPSIEELFLPTSNIQSFAEDPCDPNYINGVTPARAANCAAAFAALGTTLTGFKSNVVNASVLGQTSGNSTLQNEVANSWTAGFVARPHWIPRLSIALDWINIHLKDPITSLTLTQVMDACYDAPVYPNQFCSLFTRNSSGQITGYSLPLENLGAELFSGAQLQSTYSVDVAELPFIGYTGLKSGGEYGSLSFDLNAFFENEHNEQILGVITKLRGNIGDPRWKANGGVRYRYGPFSAYLNGRWIDGGYANVELARTSQQLFSVGPYWVWNGSVSYDLTKQITAALSINDLFNQAPPRYAALLGGNAALATYDYFGQAFVFRLTAKY